MSSKGSCTLEIEWEVGIKTLGDERTQEAGPVGVLEHREGQIPSLRFISALYPTRIGTTLFDSTLWTSCYLL